MGMRTDNKQINQDMTLDTQYIRQHILTALSEDVGSGDYSSLACIDCKDRNKAKLIAKQDCIICGMQIAEMVFELVDKSLQFEPLAKDGQAVKKGDVLFVVSGSAISILTAERTVLNYMQRLSGIATTTAEYVKALEGYQNNSHTQSIGEICRQNRRRNQPPNGIVRHDNAQRQPY